MKYRFKFIVNRPISTFAILLLIFLSSQSFAKSPLFGTRPDVQQFISFMVNKYNFSQEKLTTLFNSVRTRKRVIEKIKHPAEKTPWPSYKKLFVTKARITNGVHFWWENRTTLTKAEKYFGVPSSLIVAIIGIESSYGEKTGKFRVLNSLSNIVFNYPLRTKFFRSELVQFLLMCRKGKIDPTSVYGSYAGAIGQAQFMPSSYRKYAIDFDGSGNIDLSHNESDVIGSIANYFKKHGWQHGKPLIMRAINEHFSAKKLPESSPMDMHKIEELKKLGIYPIGKLSSNKSVIFIKLQNAAHKYSYWLGFNNFRMITLYNSSLLYAMAAFELSKKIKYQYAIFKNRHERHLKTI